MNAAPTPDQVRTALARLLEWRGFAAAPRLAKFLRTVVECTLNGRAHELKESAIAVEVFDRDPTYDPRTDPIVRVQAVRLRSKLVEYYASIGGGEDVVIDLPTGAYVPSFRARRSSPVATPAPTRSVAVLPFVDMSPEGNMQYFCDGIAEEILHLLARNRRLLVAARTSSFVFKSKAEDVRKIGEALGVEAVLEGSVRLWDNRTRITAQLTSARDGFHMWSETFDRELTDIFKLQDEIADAISRKIDPEASPAGPQTRTSIEVYRLVLLARHHFNRQTPADFLKAREYFEQAAAGDPLYGPAWSGLALSLVYVAFFGCAPPLSLAGRAMETAKRAVELAPRAAESRLALGAVLAVLEHRVEEAFAEYEQAVALDPSSSDAHDFMTMGLTALGREAEAVAAAARARELDPLSARIEENLAFMHFQFRHYELSVELYRKLLDREPFYPFASLGLAWNFIMLGRSDEAVREVEHIRGYAGDQPFFAGTYVYALARAGQRDAARRVSDGLADQPESVVAYERALAAIGLGDNKGALDSLERAKRERIGWILFVGVNPLLDPLRSESRFKALLHPARNAG